MKEKAYRKWSLSVLTITVLLIGTITTFNFFADPLQFYRKASCKPVFSQEQRYQLPGLAKNYDYDTIIVGSSMTENFRPEYIKGQLGFDALKLSISGASAREQFLIADLAVKTGKVENVIWGIDYFGLSGETGRVRNEQGPFPFYLYDKNPINDIKYLFNISTTFDSAKIVIRRILAKEVIAADLNSLYTWDQQYNFDREIVLDEWRKLADDNEQVSREYEINKLEESARNNIIKLVRSNENINFYMYFPPYSVLQHYYYYRTNPVLFENELYVKKLIFDELGTLKNVKIYDFQQDKNITFDLNNYKDLAHHSSQINNLIIDSISRDDYRVMQENIESSIQTLKVQVETLKIENL